MRVRALFLIALTFGVSVKAASALELKERWRTSRGTYSKSLVLRCDRDHAFVCSHVCNNGESCDMPERYCRDCAGSSEGVLLDFLKNVGRTYVSEDTSAGPEALVTLLSSGLWASLGPESVLNFWYPVGGEEVIRRLGTLCRDSQAPNPLVFLKMDEFRRPVRPWFVACFGPQKLSLHKVKRTFLSQGDPHAVLEEIRPAILP